MTTVTAEQVLRAGPARRPGDGTGVGPGLMVSRGLAEAMGGIVEPEETPGGGLTMVVSLPAAPARPAAGATSSPRTIACSRITAGQPSTKPPPRRRDAA